MGRSFNSRRPAARLQVIEGRDNQNKIGAQHYLIKTTGTYVQPGFLVAGK